MDVTELNDDDVEMSVSAYSALTPTGAVRQPRTPAASPAGENTSPTASVCAATGPQTDVPGGPTVTLTVSVFPPASATMCAMPRPTAVTRPLELTVATDASGTVKLIACPLTSLPN